MNLYIFQGGAYGDSTWSSSDEPDADMLSDWKNGDLIIFKIDSDMRAYAPNGAGGWEIIENDTNESIA
jgi:hypothetical protein